MILKEKGTCDGPGLISCSSLGGQDGVGVIRIGKIHYKVDEEKRDSGNMCLLFTTGLLLALILALEQAPGRFTNTPVFSGKSSLYLTIFKSPPHQSLSPGMNHGCVC